jgi:membrane protein
MAPWRLWLLVRSTASGFSESGGTRLAAAIAYYALLSLFPLVITLVAGASLVLSEDEARREIVDPIVDALPLSGSGGEDLREVLLGAGGGAGAVGIAGFVGLLWTASGMMGAIRTGLTAVTHAEQPRPFVLAKLIDIGMVLVTGLLFIAATAITVVLRVADERALEPLGLSGAFGALVGLLAPVTLVFIVLSALLRLVPAKPIPWAGVWRGGLGGALALWALANGFAVYVQNFGRYNAIYGSLGAVVVFLVFVFLAAIVLLLTAAAASRWPEVAEARRPEPDDDPDPASVKIRRALAGLVRR